MSKEPKYRILLEALPDTVPVEVRLRMLLKQARRLHGFRCVDLEEVHDEDESPDSNGKESV